MNDTSQKTVAMTLLTDKHTFGFFNVHPEKPTVMIVSWSLVLGNVFMFRQQLQNGGKTRSG